MNFVYGTCDSFNVLEGEPDDARSQYSKLLVAMETMAGGGDGGSGSGDSNNAVIGPSSTASTTATI